MPDPRTNYYNYKLKPHDPRYYKLRSRDSCNYYYYHYELRPHDPRYYNNKLRSLDPWN